MDVTESSEPTPSFSHLLGLLLEAITAYLLVRAPFLPELSCPSTHQRRRPLSPNYIRMIINLLLTSLSSWLLLLPVYAYLRRLHSQPSPLPLLPHSRQVTSSRLSRCCHSYAGNGHLCRATDVAPVLLLFFELETPLSSLFW
ncbi:hypothetical protein CMEL01_13114 [Colletotrichum melonis]|uniref:Uncharacterized protein n=1 Tax=Colletotrichum melonis TaxID=1209925 RepID=A0AAI9XY39_9PEZI|nr:hypothetical protein CMEL01_13114 [Colletotrichum melonis]